MVSIGPSTVWHRVPVRFRQDLTAGSTILFIDGFVDWIATRTYALGLWLRKPQTGRLRQYVVFIVVGTMAMYFTRHILA